MPASYYIDEISTGLRALGVRQGGVLLVHSSLRSFGLPADLPSRPEIVILALLEALGPQGTLLMPALSYETVNQSLRFDVRETPSCVGALSEAFRTRPGTLRSVHPTHSVCGAGPLAAELLAGHEDDSTPVGPRSPFSKLPDAGGQILFLGCGLRPNTSMHGVEEHIEPPYLYGAETDYQIVREDGTQATMRVRRHNFRGWVQRYDRLEEVMPNGLRRGRIMQARCHLLEAPAMWDFALEQMRAEPLFFVDEEGRN